MKSYFKIAGILTVVLLSGLLILSGCAVGIYKARPSDLRKISELEDEVSRLNATKRLLEDKLSREISAKEVSVEMGERGLVITFVTEVLFDSGKAKLKSGGKNALDKVAYALKEAALENEIGIEGHTDNVPIQHSGWKSNWELSTARATSVLHYLEEKGVPPQKLSATGYGEYRSIASNDTASGRQKNRRVEIIVKPLGKAETVTAPAENIREEKPQEEYIK